MCAFILWLSLLLRFAFPKINSLLMQSVERGFDPQGNYVQSVLILGENLTKEGLHKTIACALDILNEEKMMEVFDKGCE